MNYGNIKFYDIANGPGVRVTLWVSGCENHCQGCFQPETWNYDYGKRIDSNVIKQIEDGLKKDYISGFTLLGGDPFAPKNINDTHQLLKDIRRMIPRNTGKTIWVYTGYVYEYIHREHKELLEDIDVLVDGAFMLAEKDISLVFRGSRNQRIIDIPKSRNGIAFEVQDEYDKK